jgi:hypothetical protein
MRFLTFHNRQDFYNALQSADLISDELGLIIKYGQQLPADLIPEDHHWVPFYDTHTCDQHLQRLLDDNRKLRDRLATTNSRLLAFLTNQQPT